MKKVILILLAFAAITNVLALSPIYKLGVIGDDQQTVSIKISTALEAAGFDIVGQYNPGNDDHLKVIAFSSKKLKEATFSLGNRAALASVLKVGITSKEGKVTASMLNPEYMFYAYLQNKMDETELQNKMMTIDKKAKDALKAIGTEFTAFGGELEIQKLKKYHYMIGMQYFSDPVELNTFSSFNEGVQIIRQSLQQGKLNTVKVYELVDEKNQIAVFGVGLLDTEKGESHFLKIIGEDHVAAMPYEIILEKTEASMLHGRFRFALYWPELTMGTFTKIMSTPGDVKDILEAITQ